jgi:ribosomal protein S21
MPFEVILHTGESQESLLRRFQKMVQISGVMREFKSHQHFISKRDAYLLRAKNTARRKQKQNH